MLPQREPVLLAKQLATADRLAGGRIVLGAGAGWLAEEFAVLGKPYAGRGPRTSEYARLLRACWTGAPAAGRYGDVDLPPGVRCEPSPPRGTIPILIGGNSPAAFRRVAEHGDGWLGAAPLAGLEPAALETMVRGPRRGLRARRPRPRHARARAAHRAAPEEPFGTPELRDLLAAYASAGITRMTFDFGWRDAAAAAEARLAALAATVAEVRAAVA